MYYVPQIAELWISIIEIDQNEFEQIMLQLSNHDMNFCHTLILNLTRTFIFSQDIGRDQRSTMNQVTNIIQNEIVYKVLDFC